MQQPSPSALDHLPIALHAWEVGLVEVPLSIDGVETEGMLIVVEQTTGKVRGAGPIVVGNALWTVLESAFSAPAPPCVPGRPTKLICSDPRLAGRLKAELAALDVAIQLQHSVPEVDAVIAAMMGHFRPHAAPGITVELETWCTALGGLSRHAPWRAVSDSVTFRFTGAPELEEVVAILLGLAGEQRGIAVYPNQAVYERFLDAARHQDLAALEEVEALNLYLDGPEELEPDERGACLDAGLVTPTGLYPRVLVFAGGVPTPASEGAQRVLLAVVQALGVLTADRAERLDVDAASWTVSTVLGSVEVTSSPSRRQRELVDAEYAVGVGELRDRVDGTLQTVLVIKLRKRDAVRLARRLENVDALHIREHGSGHVVRALSGGESVGELVRLVQPGHAAELLRAGHVRLCVSAGGPKRVKIRSSDFVFTVEVAVSGGTGSKHAHDPLFDEPVSAWPKASMTLLQYAEPLMSGLRELSPAEAEGALGVATSVWNAVVLADFGGSPAYLQDMRQAVQGDPVAGLVEQLITRKRVHFGGDPRVLGDVEVAGSQGDWGVAVKARLPPGYEL